MLLVFVHDMIHRVDIHGNSILPIMAVMMIKMMVIIISFIVVCRRRGNVDEGKYLTIDVLENGETYLILCCVVVDDLFFFANLLFSPFISQFVEERTVEEEEGIKASETIDSILSRLSKSDVVVKGKPVTP